MSLLDVTWEMSSKMEKKKVKHIVNEKNDRVFDAIYSEDGNVEIMVKTGKGKGDEKYKTVGLDKVLIQITEGITV